MSERFDPALYDELRALVVRLAEATDKFKQAVLRANDVDITAESFDALLDRIEETKEALEDHLGEGAFDPEEEDEDEVDDDESESPEEIAAEEPVD